VTLCTFPLSLGIPIPVVIPTWQPSTAYVVDDKVVNGANIYKCVVGGVSAPSGGPTGTGTGIVDNTCVWDWVAGIPGIPTITLPTLTLPPCVLDEF